MVLVDKDTSFAFMLASYKRGHKVYYLSNDGITRKNGKTYFHVLPVKPQRSKIPFVPLGDDIQLSEDKVDALFIRTDPPFNEQYLLNTWLLDLLPASLTVINDPRAVRSVNEKIWASQFTSLVPKTIVSSQKHELLKFIHEEKDVVAKPTDGHGGKGVFHIKKGDLNTNVILETLTSNGKRHAILQKYIPQAKLGDKRILLLNGEPLGAVLRVHRKDDHRNNFFAGGHAQKASITKRDREIIETLKPHLIESGLYFVGIDIIGSYLVEVNVTSPTCLQEINKFEHLHLEDKVVDFVEKLVEENKQLIKPKR